MRDTLPTTKEELERKLLEFLEHLHHRHLTGRVSAETVVSQAKALWTVTAGLVDNDILALAQQLADETVAKAEQKSLYFRDDRGNMVRIRYAQERSNFVIRMWVAGRADSHTKEVVCDVSVRDQVLKETISGLIKAGYALI